MYFSKLLNTITKNSITSSYKHNNNYNIREKHIFYQVLQNKNYKNIPNKLPLCKSILPYKAILPYKNNSKLNDTKVNNTKLINSDSITELNNSNNTNNNTNNSNNSNNTNTHITETNTSHYIKIIIISSITGLISYSGLYVYLFINNIASLFSLL